MARTRLNGTIAIAIACGLALTPAAFGQDEEPSLAEQATLQDGFDPAADPGTDPPPIGAAESDPWIVEAGLFAWALSLDGDIGVKGRVFSVSMSFSDIFDMLDFAGFIQVQAKKGKWSFRVEGMYAKLSIDEGVKVGRSATGVLPHHDFEIGASVALEVAINIKLAIGELFVGYDLFSIPLEKASPNPHTGRPSRLAIVPYAGVRYSEIDIETDIRADVVIDSVQRHVFIEADDRDGWLDLVVGLDVGLMNLGAWRIGVAGDIAGFGIDGMSDLTWSIGGRATCQLSPGFVLWAGYYVLDYDYANGSGDTAFVLDTRFKGPVIGGAWHF